MTHEYPYSQPHLRLGYYFCCILYHVKLNKHITEFVKSKYFSPYSMPKNLLNSHTTFEQQIQKIYHTHLVNINMEESVLGIQMM